MNISIDNIAHQLGGAKRTGTGWSCRCPAHDDQKASLSVSEIAGKVLVRCHAGCSQDSVVSTLKSMGLWNANIMPSGPKADVSEFVKKVTAKPVLVATYDYTDENGVPLFQSMRFEPKDFRQRAASGAWTVKDCRMVLYRLPKVLEAIRAAETVYIVEGEKDVHTAETLGLTATCNPMGACKWRPEYSESLRGARVVIVPDNDKIDLKTGRIVGYVHHNQVLESLTGIAESVATLILPNGKDLTDFIEAGGLFDALSPILAEPLEESPSNEGQKTEEPSKPRIFFKIENIEDDLKPIRWLIRDYLEDDALTLIFGPPASGKSFIALSMACSIATGHEWYGRKAETGAVFYIAGEGHNGIKRRLAAWQRETGKNLNHGQFFKSDKAVDILNVASAKAIQTEIEFIHQETGVSPKLIVIDTLARNFGGGDENSTEDMGNFIKHVDAHIRHPFKCNVMLVHHSGHEGGRARGSSSLKAAVDAEFEIKSENAQVTMTATKMKDADYPPELLFKFKPIELKEVEGEMVTSVVLEMQGDALDTQVGKNVRQEPILLKDLIGAIKDGWVSFQTLAEQLGMSKGTAERVVKECEKRGHLEKQGKGYAAPQKLLDALSTRGGSLLSNASKAPWKAKPRADLDG